MLNEANYGETQQAMQQMRGGQVDKCYAEFYTHPKIDQKGTDEAGRPIYKDTAYVMIMIPGDKDNIVRRPVRHNDKMRFPQQWAQYESGKEQVQDGTPLEHWPLLTRAQVEELKFFGVRTVEALSAMPDSQAQKFMGINALKQKATDYIEAASSDAPLLALRNENDLLREQMEAQQRQINELIAAQKAAEE